MARGVQEEYKSILKELVSKQYRPVYLFHGEESYFVDSLTDYIQHKVLSESEKSFNLDVLYGKEIEFKTVVDNCRQFPMMAEKRVVVIREAQAMKDINSLETYIKAPNPTCILVISYKHKKLDGRSSFAKALKKHALVFESKSLYDNQLPSWIKTYLAGRGLSIDDQACMLMADHLGNDLSKIAKEVDKLMLNLGGAKKITLTHIEKNVGISNEYNVFELQNCMGRGDLKKTMRIAVYFANNTKSKNNSPIMIIGILFNYFSKLLITGVNSKLNDQQLSRKLGLPNPYFVKDYRGGIRFFTGRKVFKAFELLAEYDLKLKGVNNRSTTDGELLKELIFRLMTSV